MFSDFPLGEHEYVLRGPLGTPHPPELALLIHRHVVAFRPLFHVLSLLRADGTISAQLTPMSMDPAAPYCPAMALVIVAVAFRPGEHEYGMLIILGEVCLPM